MNHSIKDKSKSDISPSVKILLRLFFDRIGRNRNEVPTRHMFDLEGETILQESENISTNITRIPQGINVDVKIKLDVTDEDAENATYNDKSTSVNTDVTQNSSESREGEIKESTDHVYPKNAEWFEKQEASQALPQRSETSEKWDNQLKDWMNKRSQKLDNKLGKYESPYNNDEHPKRVQIAACRVKRKAFQTLTPPDCSTASETWVKQYKNVAKKCSEKLEEDPEEVTENEQERHINPDSHEKIKSAFVLENAAGETQFNNDIEKCSEAPEEEPDEPTDNIEKTSVHKDSLEDNKNLETYSFQGRVPSKWYSTYFSDTRFQYGRQVEALVRFFESMALQQGDVLSMKPSMKRPESDQQTYSIQKAHGERKKEPKVTVGESTNKASKTVAYSEISTTSTFGFSTKNSAFEPDFSVKNHRKLWNKPQQPEQEIGGVPSLELLKCSDPLNAQPSLDTGAHQLSNGEINEAWIHSKQRNIKRKLSRKSLTSLGYFKKDSIPKHAEIEVNVLDVHPDLRNDISACVSGKRLNSGYSTIVVDKGNKEFAADEASTDSGLSLSGASEFTESSVESREASNILSGYDEKKFPRGASVEKVKITDDIKNKSNQGDYKDHHCSPAESYHSLGQASIGSSSPSILISCPGRRSEILISDNESIKSRRLPSVLDPETVGHYDSVSDTKGELIRQRAVQRETTYQISKAALICRKQSKVITQDIQIEAEKILLVTACKRDLIDEELQRSSDRPKGTPPISVSVSIKNVTFSRPIPMSRNKLCKKYSWYFLLVLEAGTAVLASKVVQSEATEIVFTDSFQFEGHSEDFTFNVKLFAMALEKQKKKNKISRPRISDPVSSPEYVPVLSLFNLWGSSKVKPFGIWTQVRNYFTLTQVSSEASLSNGFSAEMTTHLKILVFKRGFLTLGVEAPNRLPVWNRRWCVLDGVNLRYWNYPTEEEVSEPMGHLDLMNASSHELHVMNKELCPWPKSLSLKMEGSGSAVREYFMGVETLEEFNDWRNRLSSVLECVGRWKRSQGVKCGEPAP